MSLTYIISLNLHESPGKGNIRAVFYVNPGNGGGLKRLLLALPSGARPEDDRAVMDTQLHLNLDLFLGLQGVIWFSQGKFNFKSGHRSGEGSGGICLHRETTS